ncbi:MAG: DNA-methyltransferase [Candidatus Thorarchaeota archaeon]
MTVRDGSDGQRIERASTRRRRKYIPHLAEFYFRPTHDWTSEEARALFDAARNTIGPYTLDRVYYMDCIQGMSSLPTESIDLVIADPPFGIDFDGKSSMYNRDSGLVVSGYGEVTEEYERFTLRWLTHVTRVLSPSGSAYVFSGWTNLEAILTAARVSGLHLLNHIIWHYPFGVFTRRKFVTSHYHILLLVRDPQKYMFNKIENYPQDVWVLRRPYRPGRLKNGTKLPIELVQRCIDYSSRPGDVVLDPFMGNGTTAVAARGSWRHFIGFEINNDLQPIIDAEIAGVEPGQFYIPYRDRLPTIRELAEKYPRAFKEYLRREGLTAEEVLRDG